LATYKHTVSQLIVDDLYLIRQSEFDLFVEMYNTGHCLNCLHPPYGISTLRLRDRGHFVYLPNYDTVLLEKYFRAYCSIIHCIDN